MTRDEWGRGRIAVSWLIRNYPGLGALLALGAGGCGLPEERGAPAEVGTVSEEMVLEGTYGQKYQVYAYDGTVLQTSSSGVTTTVAASSSSPFTAFSLELVNGASPPQIIGGDTFRLLNTVVDSAGNSTVQYLNGAKSSARFRGLDGGNSEWRLIDLAGSAQLKMGEPFRFETNDGRHMKRKPEGVRIATGGGADANWSLGCWFPPGPSALSWRESVKFVAVPDGDPSKTPVESAVGWLQSSTKTIQLPFGQYPVVVWGDPSLGTAGEPQSVGYLVDDTLYGAHALFPYDSALAKQMKAGLVAAGHYGDGRFDSIFHPVPTIQWGIAGSDPAHGDLLGECSGQGVPTTQIRAFTIGPTPPGLDPLHFADTAVMTALNTFWKGDNMSKASAMNLVRSAVADTRGSENDAVFWDATLGLLVDDTTRCGYDNVLGVCSGLPGCTCAPCPFCPHGMFSNKLAFLLYAIRVMGLTEDEVVAPVLPGMEARLWEAQGTTIPGQLDTALPGVSASGNACSSTEPCGIAFAIVYYPTGQFFARSGPTGESTALAVLAHTAQPKK